MCVYVSAIGCMCVSVSAIVCMCVFVDVWVCGVAAVGGGGGGCAWWYSSGVCVVVVVVVCVWCVCVCQQKPPETEFPHFGGNCFGSVQKPSGAHDQTHELELL